ncbi:MAG: response regulator [Pontiellaceae bacterium]|jgi:two-component system response regulator (stage 0 sporulation protein F)|nr:response regulator [Pontiellaceae bacterium]
MKTIFFIDDDPFVTTLYRTRLSSEGYRVEIANNGSEALEKLNSILPDLIVLDLNMPGLNGVDVLKQFRSRSETADTPVIIFSNGYVQSLIDEARALGAVRVLTKSQCPPNKMLTEIRTAMDAIPAHMSSPGSPRKNSMPKQPALTPLEALSAAADLTWQTIDLLTLPDNAPPELRRKALAGLYKSVRQRLNESLSEPIGSQREHLAKALNNLFADFYEHPGNMTKVSCQTLVRGLGNLTQLKP